MDQYECYARGQFIGGVGPRGHTRVALKRGNCLSFCPLPQKAPTILVLVPCIPCSLLSDLPSTTQPSTGLAVTAGRRIRRHGHRTCRQGADRRQRQQIQPLGPCDERANRWADAPQDVLRRAGGEAK